jgi:hypothetical protein
MYYIVLNKSSNGIYAVIDNEEQKNIFNNHYDIKTIDKTSFEKIIFSKFAIQTEDNGNTFNFIDLKDGNFYEVNKNNFISYIENLKTYLISYKENNPNGPLITKVNNYYNYLKNLNINNIDFPLTVTVEEFFNSKNVDFLHPLQIR